MGIARKSCEKESRLARIDPLTGALNRYAFFEIIERDDCSEGWSAIVYADLDGLKKINDEFGHAQGDICLKVFSEKVRSVIRKDDIFARMGGDEFVIFMKVRNEEAGKVVAMRLDQAINDKIMDGPYGLGCSFGVLLLPNGSISIDAELKVADNLMYESKKTRSRVLLSTYSEQDGKISSSTPVLLWDTNEHKSSVRAIDRSGTSETTLNTKSADKNRQKSVPRIAA